MICLNSLAPHTALILILSTFAITSASLLLLIIFRLAQILPPPSTSSPPQPQPTRPPPSPTNPTHLLIVLGSGGHTAEMLNILATLPDLTRQFTQRTYLISSGDSFSAVKARDFEETRASKSETYTIATVRRARRVHQSWLTTPFTTLLSLWDCVNVLRGRHAEQQHGYPDLILTNGPGTGVCVVFAALGLRFFGYSGSTDTGQGQMRSVLIESWARVRTLSLSGRILRPVVNRFLVQWPQLKEEFGDGVEYLGPLVT